MVKAINICDILLVSSENSQPCGYYYSHIKVWGNLNSIMPT